METVSNCRTLFSALNVIASMIAFVARNVCVASCLFGTPAFSSSLRDIPASASSGPVNSLTITSSFEPTLTTTTSPTPMYDALSGEFTNRDPFGLMASDTNLYRYVGNSPTNFNDPLGLLAIEYAGFSKFGGAIGSAIGFVDCVAWTHANLVVPGIQGIIEEVTAGDYAKCAVEAVAPGLLGGALGGLRLRRAPKGAADDLITVYRGMGKAEFEALSNGGALQSIAQRASNGAKPGLFQKYVWHSLNSSKPKSPYVSLSQSPGTARHFIIDGMPTGLRGALKDLAIRAGWSKPVIANGKILAQITMRRSDLSRTLHFAQDELVAMGGTRIQSIRAMANPAMQSQLSWRVYAGAAGQVGVGVGGPAALGYGVWYAFYGDE